MTLAEIENYLASVANRPDNPTAETVASALATLKLKALERHDECAAKRIWCVQQAHRGQTLYLRAFARMKQGLFHEAWLDFEEAELALQFLQPHAGDLWPTSRLSFVNKYIQKWQRLFPYKVFGSPEIVQLEKTCSICNQRITPRSHCGHVVGEIYGGEMCGRIVTKVEFLGMSMVENPVQKYSVLFLTDPKTGRAYDHYDYGLVRYAVGALRKPFDEWDSEWTTRRHPHSYFRHVGRNDACPCGSKKKYKKCCLLEEGVLRPHVQFTFSVPPPDGTPSEGFIQ